MLKNQSSLLEHQSKNLPAWLANPNPKFFLSDNYIVLDVETTNLEKGHPRNSKNRLLMVSYSLGPQHPAIRESGTILRELGPTLQNNTKRRADGLWASSTIIGNEYDQELVVSLINSAEFVVCHNAKFELGWFSRCGLDLYSVAAYCTQVAEYVWSGNRRLSVSLESSLARHGLGSKSKLVSTLIGSGICPSEIPQSLLKKYNLQDVEQTHRLFLSQRGRFENLLPAISTRCYVIPMLASLEFKGIKLTEKVCTEATLKETEYGELTRTFTALTKGINWNSPKQIASYLYDTLKFTEPINPRTGEPDRTDKNGRKTDATTIEFLKCKTPEQKEFKELKLALAKAESDSRVLSKLDDCYKNNDGLLYFNYNNTIVRTGRLSSTGGQYKMQGQNIARKFKGLFGPRYEGWKIGEIDYASLEFRVALHFGRDPQGLQDILDGFDIHKFSASELLKKAIKDVTKPERQEAKEDSFLWLFGSKGRSPGQKRYATAARNRWKGVDKVQKGWIQSCVKTGLMTSENGWVYYIPARATENGYIEGTTTAYNYPIQGMAGGELTPTAALYLWYMMRGLKSFLCNTVHDSVIGEIHSEEEEIFTELSIRAFTYHVYNYLKLMYNIDWYIPLGIEVKLGEVWGTGKETKLDVLMNGERIYR